MTDLEALAEAWSRGYDAALDRAEILFRRAMSEGHMSVIRNPPPHPKNPYKLGSK